MNQSSVTINIMGRLVYHDQSGISGQSSPFDEAVLEVARSGSVDIVSPYIGVDYLQRIIQVSNEWRLISDIEAWLSSLSIQARPKAWLFIRENLESIHHCPAIHAKAVISKRLAMFGSANLTNTGILRRTEMGILIDEPMLVTELGAWFDSLWHQTLPPIADEANAFVQWLDEVSERTPARREKFKLSESGKRIRASLVKLPLQTKQKLEDAPLDLDGLAQSLVLEELRHYESLEEAIEAAVNTFADKGFSLGQVLKFVSKTFSTTNVREIYFSLLQHCANHVRTVFSEGTRNRLILKDGRFGQSTKERISEALAPFDLFLTALIHHLDFDRARDLPDEDFIREQTGISGEGQIILVSDLIDCGFLDLDDVAGTLPKYKLIEDFGWAGRYKLFERAMHDWTAKKSHHRRRIETNSPDNNIHENDNQYLNENIVYGNDKPVRPLSLLTENRIIHNFPQVTKYTESLRNSKEKSRRLDYQRKIDKIFSVLLDRLLSGEQLQATGKLEFEISEKAGVRKELIRAIFSNEIIDIPKILLFEQTSISLHPDLNWKDLTEFPLTQRVCQEFLDV